MTSSEDRLEENYRRSLMLSAMKSGSTIMEHHHPHNFKKRQIHEEFEKGER